MYLGLGEVAAQDNEYELSEEDDYTIVYESDEELRVWNYQDGYEWITTYPNEEPTNNGFYFDGNYIYAWTWGLSDDPVYMDVYSTDGTLVDSSELDENKFQNQRDHQIEDLTVSNGQVYSVDTSGGITTWEAGSAITYDNSDVVVDFDDDSSASQLDSADGTVYYSEYNPSVDEPAEIGYLNEDGEQVPITDEGLGYIHADDTGVYYFDNRDTDEIELSKFGEWTVTLTDGSEDEISLEHIDTVDNHIIVDDEEIFGSAYAIPFDDIENGDEVELNDNDNRSFSVSYNDRADTSQKFIYWNRTVKDIYGNDLHTRDTTGYEQTYLINEDIDFSSDETEDESDEDDSNNFNELDDDDTESTDDGIIIGDSGGDETSSDGVNDVILLLGGTMAVAGGLGLWYLLGGGEVTRRRV
ncbi:hypothetical protein [Halorubrum vacuolatum]|nr:hypothetical protein [Halorubrum vacuolatum]